MTITESRMRELLNWLDDQSANHALPYQECARHRDTATLIRELRERLKEKESTQLPHTQTPPSSTHAVAAA